jgi:hypothetical protein
LEMKKVKRNNPQYYIPKSLGYANNQDFFLVLSILFY